MIAWIVETLIASTLLMLLVQCLRKPAARLGPQIAYALWLLPFGRMLLPPLPDGLRLTQRPVVGAAIEPGTIYLMEPVAQIPAIPQGWGLADIPAAVLLVWAAGLVCFLGYHLVAHARFCARVLASRTGRGVAEGHVRVIETPHAAGPLAFGVWRRYVALPADFADRYDEQERTLALAHELGHHARGDLLANWFALAVLACHWFNPVAWRAYRAFRADQELACDATVLGRASPALRHAYGRAIVKSAHGGTVSAACHLHTVNQLKERLSMLPKHRTTSRRRRMAGLAGVATATFAGLALTASGTRASETLRSTVASSTGVDIAELAVHDIAAPVARLTGQVPVPPRPPVTPVAPLPAAPPPAPQAPAAPAGPAAPAVPPTPSAPAVPPALGKTAQTIIIRRTDSDGKTVEQQISAPSMERRVCGTAGGGRVSFHEGEGSARRVILCTDRFGQLGNMSGLLDLPFRLKLGGTSPSLAAEAAMASARTSMVAALASLRAARRTVELQPDMPAAERDEALKGIDQGIRDLEAQTARAE